MTRQLSASVSSSRPIALITGASAGIGAEFARQLAPAWDLILVARRAERLEALAAELAAAGCRAEALPADLAVEADVERVARRIGAEPRLELLINNAGFGGTGLFWEAPYADQRRMHDVHILATLRLTHAALAAFVPRDRGAVINVASVAAFIRGPGSAGYGATKSWMTAFTEALHLELRSRRSQVRVQALCPGFTYSEFHDVAGIDRAGRAPPSLWLGASQVVSESLAGLRAGRVYVVPGWRYRLITAIATKLPHRLRMALEARR